MWKQGMEWLSTTFHENFLCRQPSNLYIFQSSSSHIANIFTWPNPLLHLCTWEFIGVWRTSSSPTPTPREISSSKLSKVIHTRKHIYPSTPLPSPAPFPLTYSWLKYLDPHMVYTLHMYEFVRGELTCHALTENTFCWKYPP